MKYQVNFNTSEWEIIGENFDFNLYYEGRYDDQPRLLLAREAWQGDIPLYLHDYTPFAPSQIIENASGIVSPEPVFSIFDKENLTFAEMLQEIYNRRQEIVQKVPGDQNPYD
jgi:hypothetical protein